MNPGIFEPLRDTLLTHGDYDTHLADLKSHREADRRLVELYGNPEEWVRKAIRTSLALEISRVTAPSLQYAGEIWNAKPCPVD